MTHVTSTPDVTVVVIGYNDAKRLPTAVRSVLNQTLRSVDVVIADDASTDTTPAVAADLMAADSRVQYVRLAENSGGCGKPRNVGREHARGRYVMFLDSDDRLERHACKNLLEALEDNAADFSMGLVRRQYMATGRQTLWYPWLFEKRRVVGGLGDCPELIQDVLSVNKLYRLSFLDEYGLAFPEDVHYEDQLFTFQAYHRARRIAIIPENVYVWRIYPPVKVRSITQRRHQIDNFHQRLEVHRRLDSYIAEHGTPELQRVKDLKFLENDMRLYLADIIDGDGTVTAEVLREAEPYLRAMPRDRFDALGISLRAACGMALRRDLDGLREIMLLDRRNIFAARISDHEGRTYLSNTAHEPGPDAAFALEAPENAFLVADGSTMLNAPFGTFRLLHEVVGTTRRGPSVVLHGRTFDALHKVAAARSDWTLTIEGKVRGEQHPRWESHVTVEEQRHDGLRWSVTLSPGPPFVMVASSVEWELIASLRIHDQVSRTPLLWHPSVEPVPAPLPLAATVGLAQSGFVGPVEGGAARVSVVSAPGIRRRVVNRVRKRLLPVAEQKVVRPWRDVHTKLLHGAYAAMRRLPLDHRLAVFEANMGTVYGDSPKYVHEEMRRTRPDIRAVWALPAGSRAPYPDVTVVERGSAAYLRALARAAYWVDNQTFPPYVRKRPGQRYLQTWHGIPLKKMGHDEPGRPPPPQQPDRGVGAWDELVVPNAYFEETFVAAYRYTQGLIRYGTPRNDPLVNGSLVRDAARSALDLPPEALVILYAPTFRQDNRSTQVAVETPFDAGALLGAFDDNTYLLLRPHYLNRIRVPSAAQHRTLDVSDVDDVNMLYVAADILITDYSSVMFDFALLRKPIVFYTYDYAQYLAARGTYFDLAEMAPGRFATTTEELASAVASAEADREVFAEKYDEFVERYCGVEDGKASARALARLLGPSGESL
ncbi:CDP-glycerol glycerophosphotransferase family protein [Intrasporangium sp.]|uniref:bifunctional glycosyltransferase/CDP-glycerol:glycerophosphate glycerophosphotransferase n=1 Tax=Intrasporangium sp. TaxID=1925024 RepID=UPI00336550E9